MNEPRCQEPHSVWGICGLPESVHEDAFRYLKGTRHWHAFQAVSPADGGE